MAKRLKQLEFEGFKRVGDSFGGSLLNGNNPKTKRPLDSKFPVLLTLRGIQGGLRSPKTFLKVNDLVYDTAKKYGVRVYEYANVGNHLHVLICVKKLRLWAAFIRELTGRIAALMKSFFQMDGKFWKHRPHTRIVRSWKKAYKAVKLYVHLNFLEGEGHISRKEIRTLKDLRVFYADCT